MSDTHFEAADEALVGEKGKIFKLLTDKVYDYIVHIGDLINFDAFGRFEKDPRKKENIVQSIMMGTSFLQRVRKKQPKAKIIWKEGNHDQRLEKYCIRNCPELLPLECLSLESLFKCRENKIEFVPYNKLYTLHGLKITHGKRVNPQSGYSAHAELRNAKGRSGVSGHTHRLCWVHSHEAEWMELGYLGSTDIEKFPYLGDSEPNWRQGFGEGTYVQGDDGSCFWILKPVEISHGHFMVDGKLY